jgi:hypothetical protein
MSAIRLTATHVAHVRLTDEDARQLALFCETSCRTRSDVLRSLVRGLDLARAASYRPSAIPSRPDPAGDELP